MNFAIGIIGYNPRFDADTETPYILGDVIPIIHMMEKGLRSWCRHTIWMENTMENLKVGDVVIYNIAHEIMKRLIYREGLGMGIEE